MCRIFLCSVGSVAAAAAVAAVSAAAVSVVPAAAAEEKNDDQYDPKSTVIVSAVSAKHSNILSPCVKHFVPAPHGGFSGQLRS